MPVAFHCSISCTLRSTATGLHSIGSETLELLPARAEEAGLTLNLRYQTALPERVDTDPVRLRQVLMIRDPVRGSGQRQRPLGGAGAEDRRAGLRGRPGPRAGRFRWARRPAVPAAGRGDGGVAF